MIRQVNFNYHLPNSLKGQLLYFIRRKIHQQSMKVIIRENRQVHFIPTSIHNSIETNIIGFIYIS